MTGAGLPAAAYAGALASLPGMGPAGLHALLGDAGPEEVWDAVRRGEVRRPEPRAGAGDGVRRTTWADAAAATPLAQWWERWRRQGIGVTWPGDAAYPQRLRADPEPPGVLFWRGSLDRLDGPCVAVVGTRRCSPDGRASAYDLGRDLAAAGVCVVSGLALGIDGAAHLGALDTGDVPRAASTVGVAASGVDVAYPARHAVLWERVAAAGAVLSETPPGRPAQAWRFPSRNRVIAALADLVVVVESHASGGSLITAEKALERGIEVRVVPGPVHAPFAAGSNQLLYDGPGPVRDAVDVLDALGLIAARPRRSGRPRRSAARADRLRPSDAASLPSPRPARPASASGWGEPLPLPPASPPGAAGPPHAPPGSATAAALDALGARPTSLNRVVERSGLPVAQAARALEQLRSAGAAREEAGWWWRTDRPAAQRGG